MFPQQARATSLTTLSTGLLAHYPLNGTTHDFSGNGKHGTAHSLTYSTDRFGNANGAASFNGASSYVEIIDGSSFNMGNDISLSAWINPASFQPAYAQIFSKSRSVSSGWTLEQEDTVNNKFRLACSLKSSVVYYSSSIQLVSNAWNHLVITKRNTTINAYLNNILSATDKSITGPVQSNGNLPLTLGAWNSAYTKPASGLLHFYNGLLDEMRIYNRTLSTIEISQLYFL